MLDWMNHSQNQDSGKNSNLKFAHDTTLMAASEEELKSLLMKVKEECEKAGLKPDIQKTKIIVSTPIFSLQIDKIESYDKPRQRIKKQRHLFADKGPYSQSYGFSNSHVWM